MVKTYYIIVWFIVLPVFPNKTLDNISSVNIYHLMTFIVHVKMSDVLLIGTQGTYVLNMGNTINNIGIEDHVLTTDYWKRTYLVLYLLIRKNNIISEYTFITGIFPWFLEHKFKGILDRTGWKTSWLLITVDIITTGVEKISLSPVSYSYLVIRRN